MNTEGFVKSETHNGITTIEFYHPKSNSLPLRLLTQLANEISFAGNHTETAVIIIKSQGDKVFCAGASFDELLALQTEAEGLAFFSGFANVINAMRMCPKFIIGRIHGSCIGGGVGLASAVDYAIAYEPAQIKLSELAVGIGPFVVGPAIERKIGLSAFSQLAIDATMWRNADWAKKKGMFAEVHPTAEGMDESIQRLANTLAHNSPEAMKQLKKILWQGAENWNELLVSRAAISGKLILSESSKQFLEKFKTKSS